MRAPARVARFSEKPDAATALDLMAAGALWNSGLFAWTADRLLAEVRAAHAGGGRAPSRRSSAAMSSGFFRDVSPDLDRRRPAGAERRGGRGPRRLRLGRRRHLAGARPGSAQGHQRQCRGGPRVAPRQRTTASSGPSATPSCSSGVQDLVVVQANGRILVMPTERAASMKQLLDALPPDVRDLTP